MSGVASQVLAGEIAELLELPEAVDIVHHPDPIAALPGPFAVHDLALCSVQAVARAASMLATSRGLAAPRIELTDAAIATAFTSERHLRIDGAAEALWGELSGFFRAADGWIRLHGNYPHHAAAAAAALGCRQHRSEVAAAIRPLSALDVEDAVVAAGGVASAVRTTAAWQAHEQAQALASRPLIDIERGTMSRAAMRLAGPGSLPADGLRVLDMTRVIAGPVAGRTLAAWGADVLRIDPPGLPEIELQHLDGDWGKQSALLDLGTSEGITILHELVEQATIVLSGYRPGSLARRGADHAAMLAINPELIIVEISAWGSVGPWGARRGFDSIVQAACGIADRCASAEGAPGALPAQALDHATGYLAAAAALALTARGAVGSRAQLSLARTAQSLMELASSADLPAHQLDPAPWLNTSPSTYGKLTYVRPPFIVDGAPLDYRSAPRRYGTSPALWW